MISTPEEYLSYLHLIQNKNFPNRAILLPSTESIYEIDLNKRTIQAPKFLSVNTDHRAETIYFIVDRYFDNMDLTKTVCLVQFINKNAKQENGVPQDGYCYAVPFYDVDTYKDENKILFPWMIEGPATAAAGPVEFAIRFYLVSGDGSKYLYNLNTQTATSQVLHGMDVINEDNENFTIPINIAEQLFQEIDIIKTQLQQKSILWVDV